MDARHEVSTRMGRWSYAVHGVRRGRSDPDVLLLHGMFVDSSLWAAQVAPLAALGRVVVLDMPGHGLSAPPPPFTLYEHADTLADALAGLGIARAVCVGWSWGGTVAVLLAQRRPEKVAALALLGTPVRPEHGWSLTKARVLVGIVRRFGLSPWLARTQIAPLMLSPRALRERPELVDAFVRSATSLSRDTLVRVARAEIVARPDVLAQADRIRVPTLVACGREDRGSPPAESEAIARAIPGARLASIEGAGHLCVLEQPDRVNEVLVPFVAAQMGLGARPRIRPQLSPD